jgi:AbiV family abortive infection protein
MKVDARLKEIARNAERLYHDANLLHAMQRYPSALSMAVLCVEESGKFLIEREKAMHPDRQLPTRLPHKRKQAVLGNVYLNMWMWTALLDRFNEVRNWAKAKGNSAYEEIKDLDDQTAVEWMRDAENSRDPDGAYKLIMSKKHTWEPLASFFDEARDGVHDREKQKGFYVDVTDDSITSTPFDITKADATRWIEHAKIAVAMVSGAIEQASLT